MPATSREIVSVAARNADCSMGAMTKRCASCAYYRTIIIECHGEKKTNRRALVYVYMTRHVENAHNASYVAEMSIHSLLRRHRVSAADAAACGSTRRKAMRGSLQKFLRQRKPASAKKKKKRSNIGNPSASMCCRPLS